MKINGIYLLEENKFLTIGQKCFRAKFAIPEKKRIGENEVKEKGDEDGGEIRKLKGKRIELGEKRDGT